MKPSHLDPQGAPQMVDVGGKQPSRRRAIAAATVRVRPEVLASVLDAGGPKGDALIVARLAGIAAAKRTADLIPLCHPLPIELVEVEIEPDREAGSVEIRATVATTARTGVEMEALTAVSVAALAFYDMVKALQRDVEIERVRLLAKEGGRSGSWRAGGEEQHPGRQQAGEPLPEAVVVTVSTRAAAGERQDTSGPPLVAALTEAGFSVVAEPLLLADDEAELAELLARLADAGHRLVVTTGGTGLSPRDLTPAATARVIEREVPGMAEQMRAAGMAATPMASLSRGMVGARGATLIVNLPGSPKGALESLAAIRPVLRHAVEQLTGGDH